MWVVDSLKSYFRRSKNLTCVVLIDGSGSIGAQDFSKIKSSVSNLVDSLSSASLLTWVVLQFSNTVQVVCNSESDKSIVKRHVSEMVQLKGGTNTKEGVRQAMKYFKGSGILFTLTDGNPNPGDGPNNEIVQLTNKGIQCYAFGVGTEDDINAENLDAMGSTKNHVVRLNNFESFELLVSLVKSSINPSSEEKPTIRIRPTTGSSVQTKGIVVITVSIKNNSTPWTKNQHKLIFPESLYFERATYPVTGKVFPAIPKDSEEHFDMVLTVKDGADIKNFPEKITFQLVEVKDNFLCLEGLVRLGTGFLRCDYTERINIMIVGSQGAGKSSTLNTIFTALSILDHCLKMGTVMDQNNDETTELQDKRHTTTKFSCLDMGNLLKKEESEKPLDIGVPLFIYDTWGIAPNALYDEFGFAPFLQGRVPPETEIFPEDMSKSREILNAKITKDPCEEHIIDSVLFVVPFKMNEQDLKDYILPRIREVVKLDYNPIVVITKADIVKEQTILEEKDRISAKLGINKQDVFVISNYGVSAFRNISTDLSAKILVDTLYRQGRSFKNKRLHNISKEMNLRLTLILPTARTTGRVVDPEITCRELLADVKKANNLVGMYVLWNKPKTKLPIVESTPAAEFTKISKELSVETVVLKVFFGGEQNVYTLLLDETFEQLLLRVLKIRNKEHDKDNFMISCSTAQRPLKGNIYGYLRENSWILDFKVTQQSAIIEIQYPDKHTTTSVKSETTVKDILTKGYDLSVSPDGSHPIKETDIILDVINEQSSTVLYAIKRIDLVKVLYEGQLISVETKKIKSFKPEDIIAQVLINLQSEEMVQDLKLSCDGVVIENNESIENFIRGKTTYKLEMLKQKFRLKIRMPEDFIQVPINPELTFSQMLKWISDRVGSKRINSTPLYTIVNQKDPLPIATSSLVLPYVQENNIKDGSLEYRLIKISVPLNVLERTDSLSFTVDTSTTVADTFFECIPKLTKKNQFYVIVHVDMGEDDIPLSCSIFKSEDYNARLISFLKDSSQLYIKEKIVSIRNESGVTSNHTVESTTTVNDMFTLVKQTQTECKFVCQSKRGTEELDPEESLLIALTKYGTKEVMIVPLKNKVTHVPISPTPICAAISSQGDVPIQDIVISQKDVPKLLPISSSVVTVKFFAKANDRVPSREKKVPISPSTIMEEVISASIQKEPSMAILYTLSPLSIPDPQENVAKFLTQGTDCFYVRKLTRPKTDSDIPVNLKHGERCRDTVVCLNNTAEQFLTRFKINPSEYCLQPMDCDLWKAISGGTSDYFLDKENLALYLLCCDNPKLMTKLKEKPIIIGLNEELGRRFGSKKCTFPVESLLGCKVKDVIRNVREQMSLPTELEIDICMNGQPITNTEDNFLDVIQSVRSFEITEFSF